MYSCSRIARGVSRHVPRAQCALRTTLLGATTVPSSTQQRATIHSSHNRPATPVAPKPTNPDPRENPMVGVAPSKDVNFAQRRIADFDLTGRVFIVTGGGRGLGLCLAEGLAEAGGYVYCLDRGNTVDERWEEVMRRAEEWGGRLYYREQDVQDSEGLDRTIEAIASEHKRLDGLVAAAGVQQITRAIDYRKDDAARMLDINYTGVLMTATAVARQMFKYKCHGSMCLIASMSGSVANKGLLSPVYNSSKAAVIQLARNLAMEWSPIQKDGTGGIRVNCISPGHIVTPMVEENFKEVPGLRETWEAENMMGRLAEPHEFKGAALFLLSNASSFMTGNNLVIDGGHTSW